MTPLPVENICEGASYYLVECKSTAVLGILSRVYDMLKWHSRAQGSVKHSASLKEVCLSTVHGPVKEDLGGSG